MTTIEEAPMSSHDPEQIDADTIIGKHWPLDAPDRDRTAAAAAALAALVRYLNHATLPGRAERALGYAGDLDQLIGGLAVMTARLPQLLDQLDALALEFAEDPSLYDDRRDRPGSRTAIELSVVLDETQAAAWTLARLLEEAGNCSAHLGHDIRAPRDAQ